MHPFFISCLGPLRHLSHRNAGVLSSLPGAVDRMHAQLSAEIASRQPVLNAVVETLAEIHCRMQGLHTMLASLAPPKPTRGGGEVAARAAEARSGGDRAHKGIVARTKSDCGHADPDPVTDPPDQDNPTEDCYANDGEDTASSDGSSDGDGEDDGGTTPNPLVSYADLLAASEAVLIAHGRELELRTLVAKTIAAVADRQQMLLYLTAWQVTRMKVQ